MSGLCLFVLSHLAKELKMKKNPFNSNLLRMLLIGSMVLAVSCGSDDDDGDTNISIVPEQQEREEGPVNSGPSVVVNNRVDNDVKIIDKDFMIDRSNLVLKYKVVNADPVIHQQNIYVAVDCSQVINSDINADGMIEQTEVEQSVGTPVASLQEAQGTQYQQTQSVPVSELPPEEEDFVFVVYGAEEGVTVPVACNSFKVQQQNTTTNNQPQPEPQPQPQPDIVIEDPVQPDQPMQPE